MSTPLLKIASKSISRSGDFGDILLDFVSFCLRVIFLTLVPFSQYYWLGVVLASLRFSKCDANEARCRRHEGRTM